MSIWKGEENNRPMRKYRLLSMNWSRTLSVSHLVGNEEIYELCCPLVSYFITYIFYYSELNITFEIFPDKSVHLEFFGGTQFSKISIPRTETIRFYIKDSHGGVFFDELYMLQIESRFNEIWLSNLVLHRVKWLFQERDLAVSTSHMHGFNVLSPTSFTDLDWALGSASRYSLS